MFNKVVYCLEGGGGREGGIVYFCFDFVDVVLGSIEIYNIKGLLLKINFILKRIFLIKLWLYIVSIRVLGI